MMVGMWTLDELVDRARVALAAEYPGAPNGRVRELPDRRSIRWYTQTGLVDRPLGMRGRVALYGPRHLLQLVALKRRQADGRTLAQIQAELTGATDAELTPIARVPERLLTPASPLPSSASPARPPLPAPALPSAADAAPPRARFWATPPEAPPVIDTPPAPSRAGGRYPDVPARRPKTRSGPPTADGVFEDVTGDAHAVGGVALGGGAILVLPNTLTPADVAAVTAAAGPLITLLTERGLLTGALSTTEDRPAAEGLLTTEDRETGRP